ncbi:histidinol-phosphate transaminase [Candidatus Pelagibacter bacterium]|nr:histidinol-phosphate transaminase [Candidatus Pelagibacter bacterium]MDA8844611.1 histidinol-phosphate transaminase [Candidatus Pelagibacter bacterium]MDA9169859.1 histidinol-phosphate transaminase [Candidatus Pelagibacter ubique]MDC0441665.1 histidinol-phosphate transaminase [Candidatus Pelagibacter ubique]
MTVPKFKKFNIEAYKPGKSNIAKIRNIIKLSANESALGVSPRVKKILQNKKLLISKYPDGKAKNLRKEISKKFKCDFERIICGAGSDEIIQMICQLYLKPSDEVIVPQYSFLMYRIYAQIVGAKVVFSKEKNFKVSINEIIKKVTRKTKLVFIANPNNPTGTYLTRAELIDLRKKLNKNILLVLDDAYFEYMKNKDYKSGLDLFKNKDNVVVIRTFSKIYGLASLRVGWGHGPKKIISAMNLIRPPFNVNQVAQMAAIEALKDRKFINNSVKHNIREANKVRNALQKLKILSNEVTANFLLLNFDRCKFSANYIFNKLQSKGIILRSTEDGYNIKNKLRLTIGSTKENMRFITTIKAIFN